MTLMQFEQGRFYSRDRYTEGLCIGFSRHNQHWAYFKNGNYTRPITEHSHAHGHDDFYRSTKTGKQMQTVAMKARRGSIGNDIWKHMYQHNNFIGHDLHREGHYITGFDTARDDLADSIAMLSDRDVISKMTQALKVPKDMLSGNVHVSGRDYPEEAGAFFGRLNNATSAQEENKMGAERMFRETKDNVTQETIDVSLITVGEIIYKAGTGLVGRVIPQLTWYEKLLTSSEKRELAVLVGTYIALQAVKVRYRHYTIDAVSAYINFELQKKLLGGMPQETLDKLFSKLEKA